MSYKLFHVIYTQLYQLTDQVEDLGQSQTVTVHKNLNHGSNKIPTLKRRVEYWREVLLQTIPQMMTSV